MSALPSNVVDFKLPKKPRVREKEPEPDKRKVAVLPIRAVFDQQLTHGGLQVLAAVCSFANRAGITWVSQTRLAKDLGISQQAVAKQFKQLRALGYLETVKKGFKGERTDTLRVIFDPSVDTETAIAVTSNIEDTRPPVMKEQQAKQAQQPKDEFTEEQLAANRQRIKQMLGGLTNRNQSVHEPRKLGDILMPKAKPKDKSNHNPQVVNAEPSHSQPNHNLSVVLNTEEQPIDRYIRFIEREFKVNLKNKELLELLHNLELTDNELTTACQTLSERYRSEGLAIPTNEEQLVHDLLVISVDAS